MAGLMQPAGHRPCKMPRVTIRPATLDDLGTLVRHRRGMFQDMHPDLRKRELDDADRAFRAWARRGMTAGEYRSFVAESGGRAVASGGLWLQPVQPRPGWTKGRLPYLMGMYTEQGWRGKGIARRIVQAAMAWSRAHGYPRITLHASEMGRPVYARLGFERTWEMRRPLRPKAVSRRSCSASRRR